MKRKTKNISSINILFNGIWLESGTNHHICWEDSCQYLKYSYQYDFLPTNIPIVRAYSYIYYHIVGKNQLLLLIKKDLSNRSKYYFKLTENFKNIFNNISILKITILLILILILANIETILIQILNHNLDFVVAALLSCCVEYISIMVMLIIGIKIFVPITALDKFSRLNQAIKDQTPGYIRHNSIFITIYLLLVLSASNLIVNLFHTNIFITFIIFLPIIYELLGYCELRLTNFWCFLIYYPVYFVDQYFTKKPTKQEQYCATLVYKN